MSPSAHRAVAGATDWALRLAAGCVEPLHVLLAIVDQEETRAASMLSSHGLTLERLAASLMVTERLASNRAEAATVPPFSEPVLQLLRSIRSRSMERQADDPPGTDILLLELIRTAPELVMSLNQAGVDISAVVASLELNAECDAAPLATEFPQLDIPSTTDQVDTFRILDAAANRAREGLRVVEDYVRFACDDRFLTSELKTLRHAFKEAIDQLPYPRLLATRDSQHDVGTAVTASGEWLRSSPLDVVIANFKRTQEAFRTLEEFSKLEFPLAAEGFERTRYQLYTLERAVLGGADSRSRLAGVTLYVLVSPDRCPGGLEWTVREAIAGGAQVIQLREKRVSDRELVALGHRMRRWTREGGALFIMNDRADVARIVDADGVHVGQEELSVKDARRVVGPQALLGVSTHSIEQARQAVLDGASYIGVGPTFPSRTKDFQSFPGLELVEQVHAEIGLPAFVIGGVDLDRLDLVLAAGARRVAVSAAISEAEDPRGAAAAFRRKLDARSNSTATSKMT